MALDTVVVGTVLRRVVGWLVEMRFDVVVDVSARTVLWSHRCSWTDLALAEPVSDQARRQLLLASDWSRRWTAAVRFADIEALRRPTQPLPGSS
ncbi:hypothetical protein [Amycolatopsis sp. cmx-4-68]|uniref:hypothetical protein n=1 Tax=Amycolatopsis sp. cmx-4-68 TaxID=2790938 RepID=UPI00397E8F78